MLSRPAESCLRLKFSSAKDLVPYMEVLPVPSPLRKSPPWIMKLLIYRDQNREHHLHPKHGEAYYAMELAPFVALRSPLGILGFSGTELTEILSSFGSDVSKEFHLDPAQRFAYAGCEYVYGVP